MDAKTTVSTLRLDANLLLLVWAPDFANSLLRDLQMRMSTAAKVHRSKLIAFARCAMEARAKGEAMLESQEHGDGNWSVDLGSGLSKKVEHPHV